MERVQALHVVLREVAQLTKSTVNVEEALPRLLQLLSATLSYDAILLCLFNHEELGTPAWMGTGLLHETMPGKKEREAFMKASRKVFADHRPIPMSELQGDTTHRTKFFLDLGLVSGLGVPVVNQARLLGVFFFLLTKPHKFHKSEAETVMALADITAVHIAHRLLQRQFGLLASELDRLTKNEDEFRSVISRELRTPLTIVMGHAAMIQEGIFGKVNPEQESGLAAIMESSRKLLKMMKEALEKRVGERTAKLSRTIEALREENIQRRKIETQLRESEEQLRALSRRIVSVQEDERKRIAREVHDELGQALTALKIDLSWLSQRRIKDGTWTESRTQKRIESMIKLIDRTIQEVRRISRELRPHVLDDLGLVAALEWQVQEFQGRTGITCEAFISQDTEISDPSLSTTVFRIFQEALTNVARHAHATKIQILLEVRKGKLLLEVKDNGRGISERALGDPKSLGLIGMRERVLSWGGEVRIQGVAKKGTAVTVTIPLPKKLSGAGARGRKEPAN